METLLEEKREEIAEYLASVTELQRKSTAQEEEVASTRQKIKTLQMELERRLAEETKSQALHMSRCQQYEDQIDVVSHSSSSDHHACSICFELTKGPAFISPSCKYFAKLG